LAFSFAISRTSLSVSDAIILYFQENIFSFATFISFSTTSLETNHRVSKAKYLFSHGAIFLAIIAASIGIVQLQQNIS